MAAKKIIGLGAHHHPDRRIVVQAIFFGNEGRCFVEMFFIGRRGLLQSPYLFSCRLVSRHIRNPGMPLEPNLYQQAESPFPGAEYLKDYLRPLVYRPQVMGSTAGKAPGAKTWGLSIWRQLPIKQATGHIADGKGWIFIIPGSPPENGDQPQIIWLVE